MKLKNLVKEMKPIGLLLLVATFASKPALDFTAGVDSPFAKFMKFYMSDSEYKESLVESRKRIVEQGKPDIARIVSFPYSLKYEEYWK